MKDLIKQNYEITKARGLINEDTDISEFVHKIDEEFTELLFWLEDDPHSIHYQYHSIEHVKNNNLNAVKLEIADIILTCMNFATHLNIDIEKALKEKIEINRNRIPKERTK